MRTCKSCGRKNPSDRDFCECGEYLRWELTRPIQQVRGGDGGGASPTDPNLTIAPTSAVRGSASLPHPGGLSAADASVSVVAQSGIASVTLRTPGQEGAADAVRLEVEPGARVRLFALIRNEGSIVDNYDIEVSGLPEDWWTAAPPTVYLVPYGSSGTYEQEVQIELHPPKAPDAVARPWVFEATAFSRASESQVAAARGTLVIAPYHQVACELRPERASGKLKARFALIVRNRANSAVAVQVDGADADGECSFRFAEPAISLQPGQTVEAPLTVFPAHQIWIGRASERRLQLTATPADRAQSPVAPAGAPPPASCPAVFRQRPWLPWWLAVVAPLAIVAIALLILLMPKQVKVPNLKNATIFDAQKLLNSAGLTLAPSPQHVAAEGVAPGTIVAQTPSPGKHVRKGSVVSIEVAEGSGSDTVPSIVGKTPAQADATLRAAGLSLGTINPQPPDPNGKIASQIPEAKQQVASGTPVEGFLAPASTSSSRKPTTLAPVAGGSAATAAAALAQAGLVPVVTRVFSTKPAGTVIETNPPAGSNPARGSKVQIVESAGFPELSFDSEGFLHFVSGADGSPVSGAPATERGEEAAWSSDGTHVAYRNGGQLFLLSLAQRNAIPQALTPPGSNAHDPSLAPTIKSHILAYIEARSQPAELCVAYVGPSLLTPQCTNHQGWELGHQVAWSPDGRSILVFGSQIGRPGTFGLLQFVSSVPFATQASDWGHGTLVTTSHEGEGVLAGALSPNGKQLALIADFGGSGFSLYLTKPGDFSLQHATPSHIDACALSWRSDGQALAVMQDDSGCQQTTGTVVTLSPSNPQALTQIATPGSHPAWQPLSLDG